jgi:hypothetical protein
MAKEFDWAVMVRKARGPDPQKEPQYVFGNKTVKHQPVPKPGKPYPGFNTGGS